MTRQPARDNSGVALYRHEAIAAVLQVRENLSVLVSKRPREPFSGHPALPSGPVEIDEQIGDSVLRHLNRRTNLKNVAYLEQLDTRSDPFRDPAQRTIGTSYLGLIPAEQEIDLPDNAYWLPVSKLKDMAFDHAEIVNYAVERLRGKLSYTNIAFALAPDEFTIAGLRAIYTAALGHDIAPTNLQRVLTRRSQLEKLPKKTTAGSKGGRPAQLYRFAVHELVVTDPFAVLRPES